MNNKNKDKDLLTFVLVLLALYFSFELFDKLLYLIKVGFKIIFPVLLGFGLAFVLNPIRIFLVKKKIPNNIVAVFLVLLLLLIISAIVIIIIPNLINELTKFFSNMPKYIKSGEIFYNEYFAKISLKFSFNEFLLSIFNDFSSKIISFLQTIISYGIGIFISIFIAFYLLIDFDNIIHYINRLSEKNKIYKFRSFLKEVKENMYLYLKSLFQENLLLFIVTTLVFYILKLEHFVSLALILALTNVIPYFGPYIGGSFAVIVALNSSYKRALIVLLTIILLQFVDNYIISPKIQSKNIDIKPVTIIISIIILGSLFGIIGGILAVPIVLIMKSFYKNYIINK